MSPRLLPVACCVSARSEKNEGAQKEETDEMPINENSMIPSSFLGRISARTSMISTRDYKTTVQLLDDAETVCQEFKKTANAQVILDYICECLNIVEKDYFGLRYQDISKHRYWMDLNKPIQKQVRGPSAYLRFRVRFYPADVGVLKEEITRYMLFVQLQRDLLHGRLYCSQNDAAILGALTLQSVIGDYDADERSPNYVSEYKLFLKQTEKLEEKIAEAHKQFKGLNPAEAELEFLKRASKLETYGFDPYTVMDKQKQSMYIGVTHRGVYVYHVSRMIHHINWDELEKVDYVGKELIITPVPTYTQTYSTTAEDFEGGTDTMKSTSSIFTKNGMLKARKSKSNALKFLCPSAVFAKHLWRHILSQQAFFTESDAKHIKPKFSKPRIPLLTRGSTFHFPTSRVYHEIELEEANKRDGPPPRFSRYPLQRQPPRQHVFNDTNKYHTLPMTKRVAETINEVMAEQAEQAEQVDVAEKSVLDESLKDKIIYVETPVLNASPMTVDSENICETSEIDDLVSSIRESLETNPMAPLDTSTPILPRSEVMSTATMKLLEGAGRGADELDRPPGTMHEKPVENMESDQAVVFSRHPISTRATAAARIFFSLLLFWLLLAAVAMSLFEADSPWLDRVPALDSLRHNIYEPLRRHIIALYAQLKHN